MRNQRTRAVAAAAVATEAHRRLVVQVEQSSSSSSFGERYPRRSFDRAVKAEYGRNSMGSQSNESSKQLDVAFENVLDKRAFTDTHNRRRHSRYLSASSKII